MAFAAFKDVRKIEMGKAPDPWRFKRDKAGNDTPYMLALKRRIAQREREEEQQAGKN